MPCGYRAIESLRLEMGYRVWSTDLTPETTPYEAGLGFCVKLDKEGGFVGRDALVSAREAGLTRRMSLLVLDDPRAVVIGAEPVSVDGRVVGRVTSGGFGYTCEKSLAYAYLPDRPRRRPGPRPRSTCSAAHVPGHRHRPPHPAQSVIEPR